MPPKNEVLAVSRTLSKSGEYTDELAIWDGISWMRLKNDLSIDGSAFNLNEVKLWRRLET